MPDHPEHRLIPKEHIFAAAEEGDWPNVLEMLERSRLTFVRDSHGCNLLHIAARAGNAEAVRRLLAAGVNPKTQAEGGETPLHKAIAACSHESIDALLAAHVDPVGRDMWGATTLHYAAESGDEAIVRRFLHLVRDIDIREEFGCTPLHYAARSNNTEALRTLLDCGADINAPNASGNTPLMAAAGDCAPDTADLLLKAGANPLHTNRSSENALHIAAFRADERVVNILLQGGIPVDSRSADNMTPLLTACRLGWLTGWRHTPSAVAALLKAGANPNLCDDMGWNALHVAADKGAVDLIPLLLAAGADRHARDKDGRQPHEVAAHDELRALLR